MSGGARGAMLRNIVLIARREYSERVRSRAFAFSTLLMAGLAVVVALAPIAVRVVDRATVTRIVVTAPDAALAQRAVGVMDGFLNASLDPGQRHRPGVHLRHRGQRGGSHPQRDRRCGGAGPSSSRGRRAAAWTSGW